MRDDDPLPYDLVDLLYFRTAQGDVADEKPSAYGICHIYPEARSLTENIVLGSCLLRESGSALSPSSANVKILNGTLGQESRS